MHKLYSNSVFLVVFQFPLRIHSFVSTIFLVFLLIETNQNNICGDWQHATDAVVIVLFNLEYSCLAYINSLVYFSCGAHVNDTELATLLFKLFCINY